jgi:hypothetical protein
VRLNFRDSDVSPSLARRVRTNLDLQRIFVSEQFQKIFPKTRISEEAVVSGGFDRWKRNSSLIEYIDHPGSFRNTTVAGQINGMELHLGVIDDPLKGRAEAHSPTMRAKTWDWFADDFLSRFSKDGALLICMTRWHVDDILGRYVGKFPDVKVLRYPAIAEHDEPHRRKGEALFPEHKPLDFLYERKKLLTQPSWGDALKFVLKRRARRALLFSLAAARSGHLLMTPPLFGFEVSPFSTSTMLHPDDDGSRPIRRWARWSPSRAAGRSSHVMASGTVLPASSASTKRLPRVTTASPSRTNVTPMGTPASSLSANSRAIAPARPCLRNRRIARLILAQDVLRPISHIHRRLPLVSSCASNRSSNWSSPPHLEVIGRQY